MLKRLLEVEPNDRDTLLVYGNLLQDHRQDRRGAERLFERALQQSKDDVSVLCDYGRLLQAEGRNLEAEDKYQRALRLAPQSEGALRNYAALLHDELHNVAKAEELYKRILEGNPSSTAKASVLCNYARLLQERKRDYDAAEEYYQKAIDYGVMDLRAMRAYAKLLDETRGDFQAAKRFYQKVLQAKQPRRLPVRGLSDADVVGCGQANPAEAAEDLFKVACERRRRGEGDGAERLLELLLETDECQVSSYRPTRAVRNARH
eukprot:3061076-Rhodomonas_salina.3